jgi:hypothetical protein
VPQDFDTIQLSRERAQEEQKQTLNGLTSHLLHTLGLGNRGLVEHPHGGRSTSHSVTTPTNRAAVHAGHANQPSKR